MSHPHPLSFKNPGSTIEYRHPQRKKVFIFSRICRNDLCHLITLLGPSSITDEIEAIHFLFCQPKRMGLQRKWYNVTYSSYVFELKGYHDLLPWNSLRNFHSNVVRARVNKHHNFHNWPGLKCRPSSRKLQWTISSLIGSFWETYGR